jgi:uncharacterized protein YprB with RNaseH-like and TPR domain
MKKPKILFYDIETSPNLAYVWGKWEQNVIAYDKEWDMLCFAWKWAGDKNVQTAVKKGKDDRSVVKALWKLFDEADVVIAHNGDKFDQRKATARFIKWKMKPPSPVVSVDTKKVAKRYAAFNSNSLDDLGEHLGLGRKIKHEGFSLWLGCMANKASSWKNMLRYNKQDVVLLEKVYLRLRPWIKNHPNLAYLKGKTAGCPNCGSQRLVSHGLRTTKSSTYRRLRCRSCAAFSKVRLTVGELKAVG